MNIDVNLEQLVELNRMKGLLQSPDFEVQVLGFEMFKNSSLFRNRLYDLSYEVKSGKLIPISWFVRKATEIITKKAREQDNYENFTSLIEPIINSILLCEPKFVSKITFNANPHRLMRNYSETSVLNNYLSDQPTTEEITF
jgi:hypothetical protein